MNLRFLPQYTSRNAGLSGASKSLGVAEGTDVKDTVSRAREDVRLIDLKAEHQLS